jgi:hypothetical protein
MLGKKFATSIQCSSRFAASATCMYHINVLLILKNLQNLKKQCMGYFCQLLYRNAFRRKSTVKECKNTRLSS